MFSGEGNNRIMVNATGRVYSVRQAAMAASAFNGGTLHSAHGVRQRGSVSNRVRACPSERYLRRGADTGIHQVSSSDGLVVAHGTSRVFGDVVDSST